MGVFENLPHPIIYFSNCYQTPIYDQSGQLIGKLHDFFVDYEEQYPTVIAISIVKNHNYSYIQWDDLKLFTYKKIILKEGAKARSGKTYPKITKQKTVKSLLKISNDSEVIDYPGLAKVILDRQVVDISGKKVVRVNDIHFIKIGKRLRVTHAGVGIKSMLRRLGFIRFSENLVRVFTLNSKKEIPERIISWRFVHALGDRSIHDNVSLNVSNEVLGTLHPADLADIIEELDSHGRNKVLKQLNTEKAADTLTELEDDDLQAKILKEETPEGAARLIEYMGTDEAADVLSEMSKEDAQRIISNIEDEEMVEDIKELLTYKEDTAGGLMSTDVLMIKKDMRKSEILLHLQECSDDYENIYDIYIIDDDERLIGTCSLRKLIITREDVKISDIMKTEDLKAQSYNTDWEDLAEYMSKYNLINVPIVDETTTLLGFVSVDDILPWLLDEI